MLRLVLATVLAAMLASGAAPGSSRADHTTEGAVVVRGVLCTIPLGAPFGTVTTTNSHVVLTPSGNLVIFCHAQLPPTVAAPTSAVQISGPCGGAGLTGMGQAVVTPSGQVVVTCHLNPSTSP